MLRLTLVVALCAVASCSAAPEQSVDSLAKEILEKDSATKAAGSSNTNTLEPLTNYGHPYVAPIIVSTFATNTTKVIESFSAPPVELVKKKVRAKTRELSEIRGGDGSSPREE